jgi:Na+/melibiose symporter-like transporter
VEVRGRWVLVRVLRDRDTALYLGATVVSGFGSTAMMLVAGVWVKTLTGSSSLAALASFCVWAPTVLGPVVGALVDRFRRGPLLVWSNTVMVGVLSALLAVRSGDRVWLLFAVLVVYGVSFVVMGAAEAALLPAVVPRELLGDVNGLGMTAQEGTKLVAPLVGAALFARLGGPAVAALDAATFAAAAVLLGLMRVAEERQAVAPGPRRWYHDTVKGASHLWRQPILRRIVPAGAATMLLLGINSAALFAVVDDGLHRPAAFLGVLATFQGCGSVLGGLTVGPLMRRLGEPSVTVAGILLFAAGAAARALPWLPAVVVGSAAIGLGMPWVLIAALTAVQRLTPSGLLGCVAATASTLLYTPTAVALALGAGLIAALDHGVLLIGVGVTGAGIAVWLLTSLNCAKGGSVRQ